MTFLSHSSADFRSSLRRLRRSLSSAALIVIIVTHLPSNLLVVSEPRPRKIHRTDNVLIQIALGLFVLPITLVSPSPIPANYKKTRRTTPRPSMPPNWKKRLACSLSPRWPKSQNPPCRSFFLPH